MTWLASHADEHANLRATKRTKHMANGVVALILALFLALNLATAGRSPPVWQDEVMSNDPGINLALDGRFASTAWYTQHYNEFWSGNVPGYPLLSAAWVAIFGVSIVTVRALDYALMTLAAAGFVILFRKIRASRGDGWDAVLLLLTLCGTGVAFCFRSARPDVVAMLSVLAIALVAVCVQTRLRLPLIIAASALVPIFGLQTVAYVGIIGGIWFVSMRRNFPEIVAVAMGLIVGLIALIAYYAIAGTLDEFLASIRPHIGMQTGTGGLISGKCFSEFDVRVACGGHYVARLAGLLRAYLDDRSIVPALLGAILLLFTLRGRINRQRYRVALTLVLIAATTPFIMAVIAKFPIYYGWMSYIPAVLAATLLASAATPWPRLTGIRNIAAVGAAVLLAFGAVIGFPARILVTAAEWQGRSYAAVESFISSQVRPSDVVFSDYAAYYPLHQRARRAFYLPYLSVMSPDEKKRLSVLVLRPEHVPATLAKIGGKWRQVAHFEPMMPSSSLIRRIGFKLGPAYNLILMRRVAP